MFLFFFGDSSLKIFLFIFLFIFFFDQLFKKIFFLTISLDYNLLFDYIHVTQNNKTSQFTNYLQLFVNYHYA